MRFFKVHWFGLMISVFMMLFLAQFFVVFLAPVQDEQNRGFVPCHKKMAEEVYDCDGKVFCVFEAVLENTNCNSGVIAKGVEMWVMGEQKTPWTNYFFPQDKPLVEEKNEDLEEFYRENPNIKAEMIDLKKKNKELEAEELETNYGE